ncbi:MAG: hypothetical protein LUH03_10075 [Oscillospiraceae bacterium]|nr:hypothetical protein [Oscillospiraceae bacterium]
MYYDIINRIYNAVRWNHYSFSTNDKERALTNCTAFSTYCDVLHMMGHVVDYNAETFDENGCVKILYLNLNGVILLDNGEWQNAFWAAFGNKLDL